jgi:hypothetical protein
VVELPAEEAGRARVHPHPPTLSCTYTIRPNPGHAPCRISRFRAKRTQLKPFEGLSPEIQGHNLAVTVLHVPFSLDSGSSFPPAPGHSLDLTVSNTVGTSIVPLDGSSSVMYQSVRARTRRGFRIGI